MAAELVSSARKNSLGGTGEAAGVLDVVFPLRSKGRDAFAPQNATVKLSVQVFHEETWRKANVEELKGFILFLP